MGVWYCCLLLLFRDVFVGADQCATRMTDVLVCFLFAVLCRARRSLCHRKCVYVLDVCLR